MAWNRVVHYNMGNAGSTYVGYRIRQEWDRQQEEKQKWKDLQCTIDNHEDWCGKYE